MSAKPEYDCRSLYNLYTIRFTININDRANSFQDFNCLCNWLDQKSAMQQIIFDCASIIIEFFLHTSRKKWVQSGLYLIYWPIISSANIR